MLLPLLELLKGKVNNTDISIQLSVFNSRLCLLSHVYYPDIAKIVTTRIVADSLLHPVDTRHISYQYGEEKLRRAVPVSDDHLLLLTTGKTEEGERYIRLRNINTVTGQVVLADFTIGPHLFVRPDLYYSPEDSSILLYSEISEGGYQWEGPMTIFSTLLTNSLEQWPRLHSS